MRFSLRLNNDLPPERLREIAIAAEDAGFDQLWISNDLLLRSAPVLVANLATHTKSLRLGIGVMNPYSMHIAEIAMVAATMQEMTEGRFLLGVGAGSAEFLEWVGIQRDRPLAKTAEAVATLRAWLGHEVAPELLPSWFDEHATLRFRGTDAVPVYVGGMGPKMLALAGRLADGALPLLYPPEHYPVARGQVLAALDDAGRDPSAFDLPACFWVSVSADRDAGRRSLAEKLAYYGISISPVLLAQVGLTPASFEQASRLAHRGELAEAAALVDEQMLSLGIAGEAADVVDRCQTLIRLGAKHLSFGPPLGPDPVAAVRLLAEHVLPSLTSNSVPAPDLDAQVVAT